MTKIFISCLLAFSLFTQPAYECTITVENIKSSGVLYIGWFNKEEGFMQKDKAVYYQKTAVKAKQIKVFNFKNIKAGTYAISILLDEDGNENLSTGLFGIPKEQYGFSNNIYPAMRPANFKEASFKVDGNETFTIRLK